MNDRVRSEEELDNEVRRRVRIEKEMNASIGRTGSDFATAVTSLKNPMDVLKLGVGGIGREIQASIDTWRNASETGIYLSKNFIEMGVSLFTAQLSQDDLSRMVQRTGANFQTLGGTMEQSTRNLLNLSGAYQKNVEAQNIFAGLGYTVEQAGEIMAITAANTGTFAKAMRSGEAAQNAATKDVIDRAKELAASIAAVTDATGLSRRKQLDMIEAQERNLALQTALDALPKEQRNKFTETSVMMGSAGLDKIFTAIFASDGALDQKEAQFLSLFGSAGTAIMQSTLDYKRALAENDSVGAEAAKVRLYAAKDEATKIAETPEFKSMIQARGLMGDYAEDIREIGMATLQLRRAQREFPGESDTVALERLKKQNLSKTPPAEVDDLSRHQQALSQAILGAGVTVGQATQVLSDGVKAATKVIGQLVEMPVGKGVSIKDALTKGDLSAKTAYEKGMELYTQLANLNIAGMNKIISDGTEKVREFANKVVSSFLDTLNQYNSNGELKPTKPTEVNPKSAGSPGIADFLSGSGNNISSIFENFGSGTLATLHGMESVIRPEQLNGIINKAAGSAIDSLSGSMQSQSGQFSQVNPEVFNDIKSQLAMLNSLMASHLPDISSSMTKQYSALRDLSPDFHA
jgi:hypothetical protein